MLLPSAYPLTSTVEESHVLLFFSFIVEGSILKIFMLQVEESPVEKHIIWFNFHAAIFDILP